MATRSWNRVELIGNLTRDPELRYTPQGTAVATFSIATNRTFVSDGERKEEADFHRVVAWNKLAELCSQLLKKGNRVFVSGRLQNRSWEGQDGQTKQTTEIVIEDMILLTSRSESVGETASVKQPEPRPEGDQPQADDVEPAPEPAAEKAEEPSVKATVEEEKKPTKVTPSDGGKEEVADIKDEDLPF